MAEHVFASIYMTPASLWVSFSRGEERYYLLAPQSKTRLPINPHADTALQDHSTPEAMAKPAQGGREQGGGGRGEVTMTKVLLRSATAMCSDKKTPLRTCAPWEEATHQLTPRVMGGQDQNPTDNVKTLAIR